MRRSWFFGLLLLAASFHGDAQRRIGIDSLFRVLVDSFPQQRVYLHLDRDRYRAGDTIWFKAYLRTIGFPGGNSTGLHVELFNEAGSRIISKIFPVRQGRVAVGDFALADSLPEGLYTVRGYTEWMANFDPALFFCANVPVYGRLQAKVSHPFTVGAPVLVSAGVDSTTRLDIQFLPEGGDAVENVPSTIAFLITDSRGLPVKVRGKVVDDHDSTVARFKTEHNGMGVFPLTPLKGKKYTAVVWTPFGERRLPLPSVRTDGVVLSVVRDTQGLHFSILADTLSHYLNRSLRVVAQLHDQVLFKAQTVLTAGKPEGKGLITTDKWGSGVLTVTVFTEEGEPLAERAVFLRPANAQMTATLSLDTLNTAPKAFNAWRLHFPDTTRGYVSVSVTDADVLAPPESSPNILTAFLFDGDLKGPIYRAADYFANDADSTRAFLDLVMLTHGWRRFDWTALEEGRFPIIRYPIGKDYLRFDGRALTDSGSKGVGKQLLTVFLTGADSTRRYMLLPIDSSGHFTLDSLVFFDTAIAYYMVNKAIGKGASEPHIRLQLQQEAIVPLKPDVQKEVLFPKVVADTLFEEREALQDSLSEKRMREAKGKEIKEIIIRAHKKTLLEEMDEKYAHGVFADVPGAYGFSLENDKDALNHEEILSYLVVKVPGLSISDLYGQLAVSFRNSDGPPEVFLDEATVDYTTIMHIHMADIAYVKFFPPPFVGAAFGGGGGAIAVYTRRGFNTLVKGPGLNRLTLPGFAVARQFYAPVYDQKDTALPDYRVTLAWKPLLSCSDTVRSVPIRFYNNDTCRHFRIVAEGMDEEGHLLHLEQVVGAPGLPGIKNQ